MKAKSLLKDLTLIQIIDRFADDDTARQHLEAMLWPKGIVCPHCQCRDQSKFSSINPNPAAKTRAGLRWCSICKKPFTVTIGTIFEDSKIPLRKWLIAWYLICSSKKGISLLQLQRILELGSYRTALFVAHRIRHALAPVSHPEKLRGTVEIDETFLKTGAGDGRKKGVRVAVMAMVQRGGEARTKVLPTVSGANLKKAIRDNVKTGATVNTDSNLSYRMLKGYYDHHAVNHGAGEFSRREYGYLITTANVESFFSLLKRGVVGTFHHVSAQHLPLYLAEFEHRHNYRKASDGERTDAGLQMAVGKRLLYKTAA